MLKNIKDFLIYIFNTLLPERKNFDLVTKINEKTIHNLPKAENLPEFNWIHPLFYYKDERVKAIIWELKYKNNTLPLEYIGKILYEEIIALVSDIVTFDSDAKFILLPIPITTERRRERGYNQSEYIAKAVLENDLEHILLYAPQWFEKIKETPRQSHSESRRQRIENLHGCFRANKNVGNKYIILIDDVVTTGSTLSEARNTLLSSGARDVFAFTVAH